jgi:hypothetical protein
LISGVKIAAFLTLLAGLFYASADSKLWTVQTVALRDLVEAASVVESLGQLGYPAYTEFAMHDGLQYARVRIGCFTTRDGAERMAIHLRGAVTAVAVAQPFSDGAPLLHCNEIEVGFFKSDDWIISHRQDDAIVFEVAVFSHRAFVANLGGAWQLTQAPANPNSSSVETMGPFLQRDVGGKPLVLIEQGNINLAVCPGLLIWQSADVAIVDDRDAILSCKSRRVP